MKTNSIRFQLLVWYAALLIAACALFSLSIYAALNQFLIQNLKANLSRRVDQVTHSLQILPQPVTRNSIQDQIGSLYAPESSSRFVRISSIAGEALYVSGHPHDGSFDPAKVPSPLSTSRQGFEKVTIPDGRQLLIHKSQIRVNKARFIIEVGASLHQIHAALERTLYSLLIGVPILISTAEVGAYVLINRALKPVAVMTWSAERISLHNLKETVPVTYSGDELESLSTSLNRMIARINESYDYTRRFIADASHELRTPLTILRGELESLLNHQLLKTEIREALGSNLEEIERLAKIVEGLFALSRLDAGEAQAESVTFDLAKLAATTTEQMCLLAEDKNITLDCESRQPVMVNGDRARLKQVIVNLVDNAIKYTLEGGKVSVRTAAVDNRALLEVRDNGIGIPYENIPHIFERFYRVDKGRARNQGGAGLGLSIVTSICHAHGGVIEVLSEENKGSTFRVTLPYVASNN